MLAWVVNMCILCLGGYGNNYHQLHVFITCTCTAALLFNLQNVHVCYSLIDIIQYMYMYISQ